jgi:transcriptional regulator with XRE-family HTH domain
MPLSNRPIDAAVRDYIRQLIESRDVNQKHLAKRIGRSQGWLNKYINGSGLAGFDDVVRLLADLLNPELPVPTTKKEHRLLRILRRLSADEQVRLEDLVVAFARRRAPKGSLPLSDGKGRAGGNRGSGRR